MPKPPFVRRSSPLAVAALAAVACSDWPGASGSTLPIEADPFLWLQIDGAPPPTAGSCTLFETTAPFAEASKTILVRNGATANANSSSLCVRWSISGTTSQLHITPPSTPPQSSPCTGPWQAGLAQTSPGFAFGVHYVRDDSGDTTPVQLTLLSNDPTQPSRTVCFAPPQVGRCALSPAKFAFDTSPGAGPQTACFALSNTGKAPLAYLGAVIDPANAQFAIVDPPSTGTSMAAVGSADNPTGSAVLSLCVAYSPDLSDGNEHANLVVATDGAPSVCQVLLN